LLWGDVGTGKSFVAACIANALLEQGIPILMTEDGSLTFKWQEFVKNPLSADDCGDKACGVNF